MKHRYIALEGVEGAGKSTVVAVLAEALGADGDEVLIVREPGGTELGEEIRRLLLHSGDMTAWAEAALFAAARAQLVSEIVRPALERGAWVISDRSYYSSLAYQGGARGLGMTQVRVLNEIVLAGCVPDVVVVLEIDPETGLRREDGSDRISGAGLSFQEAVADAYRRLGESDERMVFVGTDGTPAEVAGRVMEALR